MATPQQKQPVDLHEWMSFDDPDGNTWNFDLSFLTSNWSCIWGTGCPGILDDPAPELVQGCCSYGAHFADKADRKRVAKYAEQLDDETWQFRAESDELGGPIHKNDEGEWVTRMHEGACIFLNRPDFEGGPGCALHGAALRAGERPLDWKPEVCWQLPLRRVDEEQEDGSVISTLTEFGREGWGEGGEDFAWWCTEAPEAFTASEAVYRSLDVELRKMLGKKLHRAVVAYLDARAASRDLPAVVHPAEIPVTIGKKRKR
jgi:hypothetical protein